MARPSRGARRRNRLRTPVAAALAARCATAAAGRADATWIVTCDLDCEGVNTCEEHGRCSGEEVQSTICPDMPTCPAGSGSLPQCEAVACQWDAWQDWQNEVSESSGLCVRTRSFSPNRCGGDPCIGRVTETMFCKPNGTDPVDCAFSAWGHWSSCDSWTLQKTRNRKIAAYPKNGGESCVGSLTSTMPCGERHAPQDCELDSWMEWSGCSRRCGGGQQLRVRVVAQQAAHGGSQCRGTHGNAIPLQVTRPCNLEPCEGALVPRDCVLADWSDWSRCVERDVFGGETRQAQRYRSREVVTPAAFGGAACEQALEQVAPCETAKNQSSALVVDSGGDEVDCMMSDWMPWTLCDKTCDSGQTIRTRKVDVPASGGGKPCAGETLQTKGCNKHPCKVDVEGKDCLLSSWDDWSACSSQCGQGVERRSRTIVAGTVEGGLGCNGLLEELRPCQELVPCTKRDCEWNKWSQWGECSQTCGGGHRSRERSIKTHPAAGGEPCESLGVISEVEVCGNEPCDVKECTDGKWASWDSWSSCSRSCGTGIQWRHRKVMREPSPCGRAAVGVATEVQQCQAGPCEDDQDCQLSEWTEWTGCSKSCDGVQSRTRRISTPGSGEGKFCSDSSDPNSTAALREVRSCNGASDLLAQKAAPGFGDIIQACGFGEDVDCVLGVWSAWSDCSRICDGGQRSRNRSIATPAANGGSPCRGPLDEIDACGTEPCEEPKDCEWHDWEDWGSCSHCDGERHRSRKVSRLGNRRGKPCEEGASKEVQQCNQCPKAKTFWCVWDDWSARGHCSATCGSGGVQRRSRDLRATEVASADAVGNVTGSAAHCSGTEVDYEPCRGLPQCGEQCKPRNCTFTDWSEWSKPTCNGLCHRERAVKREANECGRPCSGQLASTKVCPNATCDAYRDCLRADWSSWTECTSEQGQRLRRRKVLEEAGPLGRACAGSTAETEPCSEPEAAESSADCRLTSWAPWSECSRTCNGGSQERSREVAQHAVGGGTPCEGSLRTVRACATEPCPADEWDVDCRLRGWSDWTGCGADEDGLQAVRSRITDPAQGRGRPCEGATKEAAPCPLRERTDCEFSEWAPWGECGRSCGGGQRFRTREFLTHATNGGAPCEGTVSESEPCNERPCDAEQDCRVSDWSLWSVCTEQCGQGHQVREREVEQAANTGGAGCSMGLLEVRGCTGLGVDGEGGGCDDSVDCEWGEWREWGNCEQAELCGMGFRRRSREVVVEPKGKGKLCDPLAKEEVRPSRDCPGSCSPPPKDCVDGVWDDWDEWGPCSATCGAGGTQMRTRDVAVEPNECGRAAVGDTQEFRLCNATENCSNEFDCVFEDWGSWTPQECSAPCNGARNRTRSILKPSGEMGKVCNGPIVELVRCNPGPGEVPPWGCESGAPVDCVQVDWSEWSTCSATCGVGNQTRSREVIQPPAFGGKDCDSPLQELQECRVKQCESVDCRLSVWEDWGDCDARLGQRARRRHIVQQKVGLGQDCAGPTSEVGGCPRKCQDREYLCGWGDWSDWSACSKTCGTEGRIARRRSLKVSSYHGGNVTSSPRPLSSNGSSSAAAEEAAEAEAKYEVLSQKIALVTSRRRWNLAVAFSSGALSIFAALGLGMTLSRSQHRGGQAPGLLQDFSLMGDSATMEVSLPLIQS